MLWSRESCSRRKTIFLLSRRRKACPWKIPIVPNCCNIVILRAMLFPGQSLFQRVLLMRILSSRTFLAEFALREAEKIQYGKGAITRRPAELKYYRYFIFKTVIIKFSQMIMGNSPVQTHPGRFSSPLPSWSCPQLSWFFRKSGRVFSSWILRQLYIYQAQGLITRQLVSCFRGRMFTRSIRVGQMRLS